MIWCLMFDNGFAGVFSTVEKAQREADDLAVSAFKQAGAREFKYSVHGRPLDDSNAPCDCQYYTLVVNPKDAFPASSESEKGVLH